MSLYGADRIVCGTDGTEFGCDWTRKALAEAQITGSGKPDRRAGGKWHPELTPMS